MNKKENIKSIFQEKFKDFEVAPPEMAWTNIKAELEKKKQKRRIIPFWWKLSGIAALVTIGFFVGLNFNSNKNFRNENTVVIEENQSKKSNSSDYKTSSKNSIFENKKLKVATNSIPEVVVNSDSKNKKRLTNYSSKSSNKAIVWTKNKPSQKNDIVTTSIKNASNIISNSKKELEIINQKTATTLNENTSDKTNLISENNSKKEQKINSNFNTSEVKTLEIKVDSTQFAALSENKLEQIRKEKEASKTAKNEIKTKKWQLTTNVSPVYANSNSSGSAIDLKYAENEKTYENNISFGVGVNYAVSKKIKIRTGINKFSLGYNTNNVGFYTSKAAAQTLDNVTVNTPVTGQNITFVDNNITSIPPKDEVSLTGVPEIITVEKGTINQKMGFYEVPLELSYALIDKRFGINLIGGISTLFLNENKIATLTQTSKIETGKADNLNNIHFSTNVGLGFKYNLIKSIQINIDPMLKYQINTFSNDVGGFKPYFFGIYSGINYQF